MSVVSNGQLLFCTFALLILWVIVLTTAFDNENNVPSHNENIEMEVQNTGNCKALCEHCGCLNFYCGEECICECNNDRSDTECIATIQKNARKLRIPFEILIQGPISNTFVRNALQFEQNFARKSLSSYRNKRSTVTIYKPSKYNCPVSTDQNEHSSESSCGKNSLRTSLLKSNSNVNFKMSQERSKRYTNGFEWFNDFSNDLVRPAPLGGRKRKADEPKLSIDLPKRSTIPSRLDKSWFSDSSLNMLTPAPLVRQQISSSSNNNNHNNNKEENVSQESYKLSEKRFPLRIEDTIRKFSESALSDDLAKAFGMFIKDSAESEKNEYHDNRKYSQGQKHTNGFQETFSGGLHTKVFKDNLAGTPIIAPRPVTKKLPEFRIPWLRPVNFFRKVKEVISQ